MHIFTYRERERDVRGEVALLILISLKVEMAISICPGTRGMLRTSTDLYLHTCILSCKYTYMPLAMHMYIYIYIFIFMYPEMYEVTRPHLLCKRSDAFHSLHIALRVYTLADMYVYIYI